jgi:tellurite methyltransferase
VTYQELNRELGNIDLYLLDQILKGRYNSQMRILDAGCGEGRNLIWFLNNAYQVYGIDRDPSAILMLQYVAKTINKDLAKEHFQVAPVEDIPFHNQAFDAIISNAVLHFAENETHFFQMIHEMHRVLKVGGSLFIRMTSAFAGIQQHLTEAGEGKYHLPDGSLRFLLQEHHLQRILDEFSFSLTEPLKTVNVEDKRCMSTLILIRKK